MDLHYLNNESFSKDLDSFLDSKPKKTDPLELIYSNGNSHFSNKDIYEIFEKVRIKKEFNLLVVLSLEFSVNLMTKFEESDSFVEKIDLYLLDDFDIIEAIFPFGVEEFRLSGEFFGGKNAVFRSWRDREAALNGWEYCNAVYVIP